MKEAILKKIDSLTKPPGSLGELERLMFSICEIQQTLEPISKPRQMVLFAGDHGVVAEGVTAWPSEVTSLMIANICRGGAASSVMARETGTELAVVDVGSLMDAQPEAKNFFNRKINRGTKDLFIEPAMELSEFRKALAVGEEFAIDAFNQGNKIVICGEMGIGNTTPASIITAICCKTNPALCVGRGAGADDKTLNRKLEVVSTVVKRYQAMFTSDPEKVFAAVSGYEIVAMAGFYSRAAKLGLTIILDGFIATAGLLIAETLFPSTSKSVIAAHQSTEPGHLLALNYLKLDPFFKNWNLRLGEGSGALMILPIIDQAVCLMNQMSTFDELQGN